jgi:hypothetical protein
MTIEERLKIHTDPYGYYWSGPGTVDGNTVLFTAEQLEFSSVLPTSKRSHYMANMMSVQVKPGLLRRHPYINDHEGPDDYIGLITASKQFALDFLDYGRHHGFVYNHINEKYRIKSDFTRFPHVIAHAQWRIGETPSSVSRIWWAASVYQSGLTKNNSNRCLGMHLAYVGLKCGLAQERAVARWFFKRMRRLGFETFGDIRAHYHGNSQHSIAWIMDKVLP